MKPTQTSEQRAPTGTSAPEEKHRACRENDQKTETRSETLRSHRGDKETDIKHG